MKRTLAALGLYVLLTLAATHPLWQNLNGAVPGDVGDPVLNTYLLGWDTHALVNDPAHIFDAGIFYPLPGTLAYSENLIGSALLALPVAVLSGEPTVAYNFVFLSGFALCAFGMYLLMLSLSRNRLAAFLAGAAFAFAPYRLASLAHIQLVTMQWLPFALLALRHVLGTDRITAGGRRPGWSGVASLVVFAWWQIAASLHGGLFLALAVGVAAGAHADRWRAWLSARVLAGAVALALAVAPLALPYVAILPELRGARPPDAANAFLAQPGDWLTPYPGNRAYGRMVPFAPRRAGFTDEDFLFMGAAVPVLALLGVLFQRRADRRWLIIFGALLVLSLALASSAWLGTIVPLASVMRVPARWSMLTAFALAGLAGFGIASVLRAGEFARTHWQGRLVSAQSASGAPIASSLALPRDASVSGFTPLTDKRGGARSPAASAASQERELAPSPVRGMRERGKVGMGAERPGTRTRLYVYTIVACVALAIGADGFSVPVPMARIGRLGEQNAVYGFLAAQTGPGAVIELPLYVAPDAEYPEGKRMYAALLHGRPIVNGYSGFTPGRQSELAAALKGFPDEASMAALRALGSDGVRWLIVHSGEPGIPRREWVQTNRARAQASGALRLVQSFNDNDLFELAP